MTPLEFSIKKQPLKYLFLAVYKDGSTFQQTAEDVSAAGDGRSAYADVRHKDLIAFFLLGGGHSYGVNLTDGTFVVDKSEPFRFHGVDCQLVNIALVYYRQVDTNICTEFNRKNGSAKITDVDTARVVYCLGFTAVDRLTGKVVERTMEIG